ncbi:MAG: 23S rRNA (pseudouridine(1915)-N(3))-methyltransferase RlmH [Merismopedia sp. SIO2A8]|nr:23S rRNA (pseudouridine(1915)-N(3))-methyltransferase RlmH [Symploca sp. SIO2B6]NET49671.1 23S rRNA (pseudouridine(1915)-N(3))-methyltransferase RlmH [Merismopedia sp. SIO2A8]
MPNFPKIRLITVGKVKKSWIRDGIQTYLKRVPELAVTEIKDGGMEKDAAKILSMVGGRDRLITLAEEGQGWTSIQFAHWIGKADSGTLVFVIGGADGISPGLKQRSDTLVSLSPMTFPHEMAQLLLVEQLYRAKTILQNQDYHK